MRVLVLGATGFIGTYLMEANIAAGHDVLGTTYNPTVDRGDFLAFEDKLVRCDIRYREQTDAVIASFKPDIVYLMAAQSYPALSWQAPIETLDTNVSGTANVFESIRAAKLDPVVVVACSSAQYGEVAAEDIPVKESHPLRPLHPYGISKVATEMLALQYWSNWRIRSVCARIFNTTGPRKTGDVCADLTQRAAMIEAGLIPPLLKVGNLETWRAITDVRDMVAALMLLAHDPEPGEVFNISGAKTYQIRQIVELVARASSAQFEISVDSALLRPSDEKVIFGDSAKLIHRTGWAQSVPIEKTIPDMLAYWRMATPRRREGA